MKANHYLLFLELQCECPNNFTLFYDIIKKRRNCLRVCEIAQATEHKSAEPDGNKACLKIEQNVTESNCMFLYINYTSTLQNGGTQEGGHNVVQVSSRNQNEPAESCQFCHLQYNYKYKNYCIANSLIKPYLHYNAYGLLTAKIVYFGDLKFVAFFCLSMKNTTACNHLANLCVLSHFSFDKNSPCSSFLLTQASDVVLKYGTFDEQVHTNKPYLFFKRGRQMAKLLQEPLPDIHVSINNSKESKLQLYAIIYDLHGKLKQWDIFRPRDINLCNMLSSGLTSAEQQITFAKRFVISECKLTLEAIINLAIIFGNNNFISLYMETLNKNNERQIEMKQLPILIEDLTADNQRNQLEDWQLVKRFMLIGAQPKTNHGSSTFATYQIAQKLLMYRSIRFVEHLEIHYKIHDGNRITLPLLKIRYKQIEMNVNTTLDQKHYFKMEVTFERLKEESRRRLMLDVVLPILILLACLVAFGRSLSVKRRRRSTADFCELTCLTDCLLNLSSNLANVLLLVFLIYTNWLAIEFSTQTTVKLTLPLLKPSDNFLKITIYSAVVLKVIFLSSHLWRLSHVDLFFIDWERPKSCDNTHFNLKNNLDTASVCSSVRTFVAENNVSAWRIFFIANEWINLCAKQKTSTILHGFLVFIGTEVHAHSVENHNDLVLQIFAISSMYLLIYVGQLIWQEHLLKRFAGSPLQQFVDLCSLSNISVLTLVDASYGHYIHGRSPHGFADTDMTTMIIQLQRESQSLCAKRGLLSDSDQQTYIVMAPQNLKNCIDRLLIPFQRSYFQSQYQEGVNFVETNVERTAVAYTSINRFFCAFIDHAIKDMDYIIREKTVPEQLFDCEYENFLTDNKGTFYIDKSYAFGKLLLYGNDFHIFVTQFTLFLAVYLLTISIAMAVTAVCIFNLLMRYIFKQCVRSNITNKAMIDKRFLI